MSNHDHPEGCAPDDQRCESLVKGTPGYYRWTNFDRRCSRRANQSRDGFPVCYIHAKTDAVERWMGT